MYYMIHYEINFSMTILYLTLAEITNKFSIFKNKIFIQNQNRNALMTYPSSPSCDDPFMDKSWALSWSGNIPWPNKPIAPSLRAACAENSQNYKRERIKWRQYVNIVYTK